MKKLFAPLCLSALALALTACDKSPVAQTQAPLAKVRTEVVAAAPLSINNELSGRVVAPRVAQVSARVAGVVLKRVYSEGAEVKQGDVLFLIDPAPFKADLDSAQAALSKSKAIAQQSKLQEQRYAELIGINAISRQDYDNAQAQAQQSNADVAANQAAVQRARLNLGYATVTAPISGRIGISSVTPGALVTASQDTALTTIRGLDTMYVDLTRSSVDLLRLRKQSLATNSDTMSVSLILEDGTTYSEKGRLELTEVAVDESTGSVTLRAIFPNPQQQLLPGMFVRARVDEGVMEDAILAPQQGVTRDAKGNATALVVNKDNKVEQRTLETGETYGDKWLVLNGLHNGDRLIVEGSAKVTSGQTVKAVEVQANGGNA